MCFIHKLVIPEICIVNVAVSELLFIAVFFLIAICIYFIINDLIALTMPIHPCVGLSPVIYRRSLLNNKYELCSFFTCSASCCGVEELSIMSSAAESLCSLETWVDMMDWMR